MSNIDLNKRLDTMEEKIDNLTNKLDHIVNLIKNNKENCEKMGNHIDFVESVYENVKNPLGYVCSKISYLSGNNTNDHKYLEK